MKPPVKVFFGTVTACCLALQVGAQSNADQSRTRDRDEVQLFHKLPRLGQVEEAKKIIGLEVRDSQGQKVGKIKDMAVDLEAGRIAEVLVASGGALGVGEKVYALPPELFAHDESNSFVRVNLDQARLNSAPVFDYSKWGESVESARVAQVYQYYNIQPWFAVNGQPAVNHIVQPHDRLGYLKPADKLIGFSARNLNDEKLGKVENLMIDLPAGRVVEVVLGTGGFLGMGDELCAIPPGALHYNADHSGVLLDTTKDALKAAPRFKSRDWPDASQPDYVVGVYRYYKVEPYFNTDADNTAENVRDRNGGTLTPMNQSNRPADIDLTARIRKDIMSAENLSMNARNVKVITVDGKVTLRGPVNSEEEKMRIGQIADRLAEKQNVDNQLQVKQGSAATHSEN